MNNVEKNEAVEMKRKTKEVEVPRVVDIGTQNYTRVVCLDKPSFGGACHEYRIIDNAVLFKKAKPFSKISFQRGPVKECGVNGCHHEDLLAILIDRLEHFQRSAYACRENALALTKLEEAMHWLNHRTQKRVNRGIEGTNEK